MGSKELWVSAYMKYVRECVRACVCVCVCSRAWGGDARKESASSESEVEGFCSFSPIVAILYYSFSSSHYVLFHVFFSHAI